MKLILSGGGDREQAAAIDRYFADSIDLEKRVLYIPVAMESSVDSAYDECYNWFCSTYGEYGITNIEMCTDLKSLELDNRFSAVYVGGGNTFMLLKKIRESNFEHELVRFLEEGGVFYGGSAGAIICGKTIKSAEYLDENKAKLKGLSALNLLNGFDVFCHYAETKNEDKFIDEYENSLYILYEESGLVYDGKKAIPIGKEFKVKR